MGDEVLSEWLSASVREEWPCVRVTLAGEADIANAFRLRTILDGIARQYPAATAIVDVGDAFLALCAIRVLVEWAATLRVAGGFVALAGVSAAMQRAVRVLDPEGIVALVTGPGEPPADRGVGSRPRSF